MGPSLQQSTAAPVYDFYEIDKCFPPTNANQNLMVGDERRLIPIYICKPLREVVKMTPAQAEVLQELAKIDEMDIQVSLVPPKTITDHARKTRLIPLAFICGIKKGRKERAAAKVDEKEKTPPPPIVIKKDPDGEMDVQEDLIKKEKIVATTPPPSPPAPAPCPSSSPARSESPAKPQFQCDRCSATFFMKRAMLRHMYSHK